MAKKDTVTCIRKIFATGQVEEGQWEMNLEQMQKFVGGYIEYCPCTIPGHSLVVNENGLHDQLLHNPAATLLVREDVLHFGIKGDVLLVKS
jgi:hypothetical protein